ncbi:hypothetical protein M9Y10_036678 [Tritrichomonas musculus]|uniref:Uncharacterized protein n=1 Tax=Tritrichomonas musculus TaxID=1915356 RepID=A0ABR2GTH3_9EUKA
MNMSLAFVINPILNRYQKIVDKEESSPNDNSECSLLKNRIIYAFLLQVVYVTILLIILIIVVYFIFPKSVRNVIFSFDIGSMLNIYGLLLFGISMGFGMIYYPMQLILYCHPLYSIRYKLALIYDNIKAFKDYEKDTAQIFKSCYSDYVRLSKMKHKKNKIDCKEIVLSLGGGLLMMISIVYLIIVEIFFCVGKDYVIHLFNSIQCNVIKQLFLFTFISLLN